MHASRSSVFTILQQYYVQSSYLVFNVFFKDPFVFSTEACCKTTRRTASRSKTESWQRKFPFLSKGWTVNLQDHCISVNGLRPAWTAVHYSSMWQWVPVSTDSYLCDWASEPQRWSHSSSSDAGSGSRSLWSLVQMRPVERRLTKILPTRSPV